MEYRRFGKLDWNASILGFGAMRLPIIGDDFGKIDEPEAIKMIRYAIDNGVNYVDTAYPYHRQKSEILVGKALRDGYRQRVKLATKMPTWLVKSQEDMDKYLNEQLAKLGTDHIDFYLLHGLSQERWQNLTRLQVLEWADRKMDEGKIRHFGFSFHDEFPVFKAIVDAYPNWTFCQILYNYMDAKYQAGTRGLRYASSKGLAVVVMEPIAGGRLASAPPKVEAVWAKTPTKKSPAEWALSWVWQHPEVTVALSGMSTFEQVKENVESANRFKDKPPSEADLRLINQAVKAYTEVGFINCTGCRYCSPCPNGVDIPAIIALYNEYFMKNRDEAIKEKYKTQITPENRAKNCVKCGKCEELCPQHIAIKKTVGSASFIFDQNG